MDELVDNMILVDSTGQFVVSAAPLSLCRDGKHYSDVISASQPPAIEKTANAAICLTLITSIWGADYQSRAEELNATDDNFRRICKRIPDRKYLALLKTDLEAAIFEPGRRSKTAVTGGNNS